MVRLELNGLGLIKLPPLGYIHFKTVIPFKYSSYPKFIKRDSMEFGRRGYALERVGRSDKEDS